MMALPANQATPYPAVNTPNAEARRSAGTRGYCGRDNRFMHTHAYSPDSRTHHCCPESAKEHERSKAGADNGENDEHAKTPTIEQTSEHQ